MSTKFMDMKYRRKTKFKDNVQADLSIKLLNQSTVKIERKNT